MGMVCIILLSTGGAFGKVQTWLAIEVAKSKFLDKESKIAIKTRMKAKVAKKGISEKKGETGGKGCHGGIDVDLTISELYAMSRLTGHGIFAA